MTSYRPDYTLSAVKSLSSSQPNAPLNSGPGVKKLERKPISREELMEKGLVTISGNPVGSITFPTGDHSREELMGSVTISGNPVGSITFPTVQSQGDHSGEELIEKGPVTTAGNPVGSISNGKPVGSVSREELIQKGLVTIAGNPVGCEALPHKVGSAIAPVAATKMEDSSKSTPPAVAEMYQPLAKAEAPPVNEADELRAALHQSKEEGASLREQNAELQQQVAELQQQLTFAQAQEAEVATLREQVAQLQQNHQPQHQPRALRV